MTAEARAIARPSMSGGGQRTARTRVALAACSLGALLLAACDPGAAVAPVAPVLPARAEAATTPPTAPDTSVPAADSVMNPATGASRPDATAGRSNTRMTAAEESSGMPMAGQNNDHSAPIATGKRASSP